MNKAARVILALAIPLGLSAVPTASSSAPADPAARGLDAFIHVAPSARSGGVVALDLEAFGFADVTTPAPLAGATVTLAWDPEHLGEGVTTAPPAVEVKTDATGHAIARVAVPEGPPLDMLLLAKLGYGEHTRTREIAVRRTQRAHLELHVAEAKVVPGDEISAWALLTDAATDQPIAGQPIKVALTEDGYPRTTVRAQTDLAGTAMVRVPIPSLDDPLVAWSLSARVDEPDAEPAEPIKLALRDETPGAPWLDARFDSPSVRTGDPAGLSITLRDGSDEPLAGAHVRYWTGPRGTTPPATDDAWQAGSTDAVTDASGEVHATITTPKVVRGASTTVSLLVKASVQGRPLEANAVVEVGAPTPTVTISPEAKSLVPGLEQRLLLRVLDERARGVSGDFALRADGLDVTVHTDPRGLGEATWRVPSGVGASRDVGPCAGGVAATVTVKPVAALAALGGRTDPFQLCTPVDRDAHAMLKLDRTVARVGDSVHLTFASTTPVTDGVSVVARSASSGLAASAWIDPKSGGDLVLGEGRPGVWQLTGSAPSKSARAPSVEATLLVLPRTLPRLSAKVVSARVAPGGRVEIDADLTDADGKPLTGTVASEIVDLAGGGSLLGIRAIDTRTSLCSELGADEDRCDEALAMTPDADAERRGLLGERIDAPLLPLRDPAGSAKAELERAFADVLRSLEGAVYESSASPDTLLNARRKTSAGWEFNPELLTLTTAAMSEPPVTPGGEAISLGDLVKVDRQVTFDNVARRVTRLKLFELLSAVRTYKHEHKLDDDEPVWKDPNALLRRMVATSTLSSSALLDPWGGTFAFTASRGAGIPFLSVVRGFELHSPGPDGALGTADDVSDPFARVVSSNTPYARASAEDRIADAKFDMEVGDATVEAWTTLLRENTGSALGLSGSGEGGGGSGYGNGSGRLGGSHTTRGPSVRSSQRRPARWTAPVRTDAQGHVRLSIPLDDLETTWGIGLVAIPDRAPPATAIVRVPVALPASVRVEAGERWSVGDEVAALVTVRNRTANALHASLAFTASGAVSLADARAASRSVDVPAASAFKVPLLLRSTRAGDASLTAKLSAQGVGDDQVTVTWDVLEKGVFEDRVQSTWVSHESDLEVSSLAGESLSGGARLTLERGIREPLEASLAALDPDRLRSQDALIASLEVASRVSRWASAQPDGAILTARADESLRRAHAKLSAMGAAKTPGLALRATTARALLVYAPPDPLASKRGKQPQPSCPAEHDLDPLSWVEAEPAPTEGSGLPCWDTSSNDAAAAASASADPKDLARAVLAFAERPHRTSLATALASRLSAKVSLTADGAISLASSRRDDRVLVYAALARGASLGAALPASADRLIGWLSVDRDARGGYGSPLATRAVVRALLGAPDRPVAPSKVIVRAGDQSLAVLVPATGRVAVPLPANTARVAVQTLGAPVLARLGRKLLRSFSSPPAPLASAFSITTEWPASPSVDHTGTLHVIVRGDGKGASGTLRIPMPPGASLAESTRGAVQVQGTIVLSGTFDAADTAFDLPVLFTLSGHMLAREATFSAETSTGEAAVAPARALDVRATP